MKKCFLSKRSVVFQCAEMDARLSAFFTFLYLVKGTLVALGCTEKQTMSYTQEVPMRRNENSECTMCGATDVPFIEVDESTAVCESCLDSFFFQCDKCGKFWLDDPDYRVETEDGDLLCHWCAGE